MKRGIFEMKLGKRIVSLLIASVIAVTSWIPINLTVFASDPDYQYYDDLQYPDAGAVHLEKTATLVEGTQNQWDIQLKVQGKNMPSTPTDVVLVIDTSGSMNFSAGTTDDLLICGEEEHQHDVSCYACNTEEHQHTMECWLNGCAKTEHTHGASCYVCNT